jgi:hypothetical protein
MTQQSIDRVIRADAVSMAVDRAKGICPPALASEKWREGGAGAAWALPPEESAAEEGRTVECCSEVVEWICTS